MILTWLEDGPNICMAIGFELSNETPYKYKSIRSTKGYQSFCVSFLMIEQAVALKVREKYI